MALEDNLNRVDTVSFIEDESDTETEFDLFDLPPRPRKHKVDSDLLDFSKQINQNAFVGFGFVLLINFLFFVMYCVVLQRVFIFPVAEMLYLDVGHFNGSGCLHVVNWVLLITVIATQIQHEMCIDHRSAGKIVLMFLAQHVINVFGADLLISS